MFGGHQNGKKQNQIYPPCSYTFLSCIQFVANTGTWHTLSEEIPSSHLKLICVTSEKHLISVLEGSIYLVSAVGVKDIIFSFIMN